MIISDDEVKRCLSLIESGQKARAVASAALLLRTDLSDRMVSSDVIENIKGALKRQPSTRDDRIDSLKVGLKQGAYNVDSGQVAAKMLGRIISDNIR